MEDRCTVWYAPVGQGGGGTHEEEHVMMGGSGVYLYVPPDPGCVPAACLDPFNGQD